MKTLNDHLSTDENYQKILSQTKSEEERKKIQSIVLGTLGPLWDLLGNVTSEIEKNPSLAHELNDLIKKQLADQKNEGNGT